MKGRPSSCPRHATAQRPYLSVVLTHWACCLSCFPSLFFSLPSSPRGWRPRLTICLFSLPRFNARPCVPPGVSFLPEPRGGMARFPSSHVMEEGLRRSQTSKTSRVLLRSPHKVWFGRMGTRAPPPPVVLSLISFLPLAPARTFETAFGPGVQSHLLGRDFLVPK